MIGMDGEKESKKSVLLGRLDDNDDDDDDKENPILKLTHFINRFTVKAYVTVYC